MFDKHVRKFHDPRSMQFYSGHSTWHVIKNNVLGGVTPRKNSHKIYQFTFCIVFHTAGQISTERW